MLGDSERELRWNLTQAQEDLLVQFERAQQLQKRVEVLEETLEQISVIASNQGKENPSAAIMEIRSIVNDLMLPKRT
jgi:AraC-like DNA-binding protein